MTRARNKNTGEIEEASQLNRYKNVNAIPKGQYECPNMLCRYPATPWAVNTEKRSPAFQYKKHHAEGCHFETMTGSDKHSNSDAGSSSFKLPYVTDFIEPRKQSGDGTLGSGGKVSVKNTSGGRTKTGISRTARKNQYSSMLGALVDFYLEDPDKHGPLYLNLLNRPFTYRKSFQEITSKRNIGYKDNFVFYCEIKNSVPIVINEEHFTIELMRKHQDVQNYKVSFDTDGWTEHQKQSLIESLKYVRQLSTEAFKDRIQETAYIFFIGKQDKSERHVFHCVHSQFAHPYFGVKPRLLSNVWGTFKLETEISVASSEVENQLVDFESKTLEDFVPEPEPE
ncbi:hypothetical protein DA72_14355, partial [Vibrio cholerae O1 biovar El Tor]